jgi:hypothetical protein
MEPSSFIEGHIPDAILKVERAAVPACGFADCTRAASDPARPALRPDREELATGERINHPLSVSGNAARS